MRQVSVFNFMTMNGFFKGPGGDIRWNGHRGGEERDYAVDSMQPGNIILMGRATYELMIQWWPTPQAIQADPVMAAGMNDCEKIVFSRTLKRVDWKNATLAKGDLIETVRKLKQTPGKDLTVLGSGSLVTQLAEAALIDEYQFMINPVAIGEGTSVFRGLSHTLQLELVSSRAFNTGSVLVTYKPIS